MIIVTGFLTAMRQEVTRAHKGWALDNVTIHNEVLRLYSDEIRTSPAVRSFDCNESDLSTRIHIVARLNLIS